MFFKSLYLFFFGYVHILIEGFFNFRVGEYKELLDRIVEVSVFSYLDLTTF